MPSIEEQFNILRKVANSKNISQRILSYKLGYSLGKLNYCLKHLKKHGLIKIKRFKNSQNKMAYKYLLTAKGIKLRTNLTINYMKRKMAEYDELKKELKR